MKKNEITYTSLLLFLSLVMMFSGCSSSTITSSWKSDKSISKSFKKILVIAITGNQNHGLRENMESHLAEDLKQRGYTVIQSFQEYGPKSFEGINEKEALDKFKNSGVDAVITITMLNKEKERHYVPGRVYYTPYFFYHRRFWGYYTTIQQRIYEPGYYTEQTNYFWESNLYDLSDNTLLYSVQTKTFNAPSSESIGHEYGRLIVKDMTEKGVIN
ncbi:MAG: hypothetical protein FGM46_02080 [Ferruginibacter sp.]|nr:hypothetical protein [Ferruginibacter sp.]